MTRSPMRWAMFCALAACWLGAAVAAGSEKEAGLAAHYTFDEGEGTVLHDVSGNGVDGAVHNATWIKWTKTPGGGGALKFGATHSYVDLGDSAGLALTGDMTVMAWVKLEADPYPNDKTNWTIVTCEDFKKSGFLVRIEGGSRILLYRTSRVDTAQQGGGKVSLANNVFYHLAVTYEAGQAALYINGVLNCRFPLEPAAAASLPLLISGKGQSFQGLVDDLKIYRRALGAEEIAAARKEGAADHTPEMTSEYEVRSTSRPEPAAPAAEPAKPAKPGLVLHYDFTEREGEVLHDKSGHGHDARIQGAQWITTERGAALDFDAVDDYLDCGNPPGLRIGGALTVAVWVRVVPHKDKNRYVLSKHGWNIYIDIDGRPHLETRNAANKKWVDLTATKPIVPGEWNLIVASHDPAAREIRLYVNGESAGETTREDDTLGGVGGNALSFARYLHWPVDFNGLLGGFMVWTEVLSAERIAELIRERPDDALTPQHRLAVTARRYYRAKKLTTDLQLQPRGPLASQDLIARVELLDAAGKTRQEIEIAVGADHHAHAELDMPGEPGAYRMRAVLRDPEGVLAQATVPVEIKPLLDAPDPAWLGSQAGLTRDVPPPWTPLETEQKGDAVVVTPWGRRYEFKPDSVISAIYVGEHNLLAAPVRLLAETGQGAMRQVDPTLTIAEDAPDRVRLSRATKGEHPLQIDVTIDYDGMIWFDWKITGPPNPLTALTLEIPLAEKYARLLWHNRYGGRPWAEQKPGFLPEGGFTAPFLPALWLGDEDHGLQWFAESDAGWHLKQPDRAIEIVRDGDRVILRVHMIDAPAPVGEVLAGSFGLQATPVKPWGKTLWDYRFQVMTNLAEPLPWYVPYFDKVIEEYGLRTITLFENWNDAHSYVSTTPEREEKLRGIVKIIQERDCQALLYFGGFISSLAPEADLLWDECIRMPAGGWTDYNYPPTPRQKLFGVCYNSIWQDLIADGMERAMREFDLDGLYLDGVGDVAGCTNTYHGCGYTAPDGSVRPTYPVRATRKLLQRIYRIVKSHKPDGQVKLHQSGQMIAPVLGFATSTWDGEQFTEYQDKFLLDFLPLDTFRTEFMGRQWGVPAEMLQYRLPGTEHQKKGLFLLHDVNDEADYETNRKLFELFDEFGRADATWLPYWSNGDFVTVEPAQAKASLYRHPTNGVLVMVTNTGREAARVSVQLNLDALENLADAGAVDTMTGETVPLTRGRFSEMLDPVDWRLIWVKP